MSKKIDLGMREGTIQEKMTDWMRHQRSYNRAELIAFGMTLGLTKLRAGYHATSLLSPRLIATHQKDSDNRGSVSNAWGHIAYNHKLVRKPLEVGKKKLEKQRFCFRYRKEALPVLKRKTTVAEAQKVPVAETAAAPVAETV
ncbi:MAG: hypothetical protein ABFD15_02190 [Methanofastidiosum sp.]